MTDTKPTPQEQEIARFQTKLDAAPKGSKLSANMTLRIAIAKASLVEDETQRSQLEQSARQVNAETIKAIEAAEAEDAAAAKAASA